MNKQTSLRRDSLGDKLWDGKLRVSSAILKADKHAEADADVGSSPEHDNRESLVEISGDKIEADSDLLDSLPSDESDIDLNHSRVRSISALQLERFIKLERLCLRQNQISNISFPIAPWGRKIRDLDLYDNLITHVNGLDDLLELESLDLSFNKIKRIKNVQHLENLLNIYFVQNRITKIENLGGLTKLTNLELAANRIREIENLDGLESLQELWLGKNKISELKNLQMLQNLTLLSIQSNRITSDSLGHLAALPKLEQLYISHNLLTSVEQLASCTSLRVVDISSNPISSLQGFKPLQLLEELWASSCELANFDEIDVELGDKKALTTVYFEGNPMQKANGSGYRSKIRLAVPQVKQIDATFVDAV